MHSNSYVDIAVGVLKKGEQVCLSLRQKHQSHADFWEFPGGKIEANESIEQALVREFQEELGVNTSLWQPLIEIPWHYEKISVRLHVYISNRFEGNPFGKEGQLVRWVNINQLEDMQFPEANAGIVSAILLANQYMITGPFIDKEEACNKLTAALESGVKMCQLRVKHLDDSSFTELANMAIDICHRHNASLILNGEVELLDRFPSADGVQLSSDKIYRYKKRPVAKNKWLGVSTHTDEDIKQALMVGADFILLSPIHETNSHPGVSGIGWQAFYKKVKNIPVPVYALGGMQTEDTMTAIENGGQGIAAISSLWK